MKLLISLLSLSSTLAFMAAPTRVVTTQLFAEETTSMGAKAISELTAGVKTIFDSEQVDGFLPHRYPFALVDKVVEYEAGKRAVGIKSVTKVSCVLEDL